MKQEQGKKLRGKQRSRNTYKLLEVRRLIMRLGNHPIRPQRLRYAFSSKTLPEPSDIRKNGIAEERIGRRGTTRISRSAWFVMSGSRMYGPWFESVRGGVSGSREVWEPANEVELVEPFHDFVLRIEGMLDYGRFLFEHCETAFVGSVGRV